jgi:hypothetical protein
MNDHIASSSISRAFRAAAGAVFAVMVAACGDPVGAFLTDDCKDEMNATRAEFGEPQKITDAPHEGDWRLEIWSYFDRGFIRSFEWGEAYRDCKVADRPIATP